MKGHTHALSGALAWLAISPLVDHIAPQSKPDLVFNTILAAGAALVPDLDHPQSTIAHTFGWPTQAVARVTAWVWRGHRQGTHSLLFAAVSAMSMWMLTRSGLGWVGVSVFLGLGARGLGWTRTGPIANFFTFTWCTMITGLCVFAGYHATALPAITACGVLAHAAGDTLTPSGVPWLWPWPGRVRLPVFVTSGARERWIAVPLITAAIVVISGARLGLIG